MRNFFSISLQFTAALLVTGCVSLEQAAPPVAMLGLTTTTSKLASLEQGRNIYITRCAKCHSVEPVQKYSLARWKEILPEMSIKSKLGQQDAIAVSAYVMAVLKS